MLYEPFVATRPLYATAVFQCVLQSQAGLPGPKLVVAPEYRQVAWRNTAENVEFLTVTTSPVGGETDWLERFVKLVKMHTSSPALAVKGEYKSSR